MVAVGENPASPRGEYATSPHFRITHDDNCAVAGQEQLVRKGVVVPAKKQLPGAASFPGRLVRPDRREVVSQYPSTGLAGRQHTRGPGTALQRRTGGPRASEVSTLLPICRHFVSHAKIGFDGRRLELPGRSPDEVAGSVKYADAFHRLSSFRYTDPVPNCIVYATLLFGDEPEVTDDHVAIPLFAGPTDPDRRRPLSPHRLRIDWSTWTKRRRESTLDRIQQHRSDAKRFHRDKHTTMLVFAYAKPDLVDLVDLVIDDPADYCIIAAQRDWVTARRQKAASSSRASRTPPPNRA